MRQIWSCNGLRGGAGQGRLGPKVVRCGMEWAIVEAAKDLIERIDDHFGRPAGWIAAGMFAVLLVGVPLVVLAKLLPS